MAHIKATTKTLIVNEKGELLLLKIGVHTARPERSYTHDLPGGFIDDGEFERRGAVREVKEETDIDLAEDDLELMWAGTDYYIDGNVSFTHLFYFVRLDHTPEVKVSWEHESFAWVKPSEAIAKFDKDQRPRFITVVEYLQKLELLSEA